MANTDSRSAGDLARLYSSQIEGKTILTTGVSPGGMGAAFALALASNAEPAELILAARNASKLEQTARDIREANPRVRVRTLEVDLGSLSSVREAAAKVMGWEDLSHIDVLMNNAGVMAIPWSTTPEGYDSQFTTNHLGPFLFTNLIMDKILASRSSPRIVNITSDGHRLGPVRFDDWNFQDGKSYDKWQSYGQSKTANMLMALSLASKLGGDGNGKNLKAFSVHPGLVQTGLAGHLQLLSTDPGKDDDLSAMLKVDRLMGNAAGFLSGDWMSAMRPLTPEVGANTHVYAAFDPDVAIEHNGGYLQSCRISDPWKDTVRPWATSLVEAERLWKLSEELVGEKFEY